MGILASCTRPCLPVYWIVWQTSGSLEREGIPMPKKAQNAPAGRDTGYIAYTRREYACGISFFFLLLLLGIKLVLLLLHTGEALQPLFTALAYLCLCGAVLFSEMSWLLKIGSLLTVLVILGFHYGFIVILYGYALQLLDTLSNIGN